MSGGARAAEGVRVARGAGEPPLFLHEMIEAAPRDAAVLDAGCGPGTWTYAERPDFEVAAFDVKFPPGPPAPAPRVTVFRGDLARLPLRDAAFDLVICHYVLEHVTELEPCCDELARVIRPGGTLYLSVPRAASFDDRLYRFAGYFAKYALLKLRKRIEHQQRFDFTGLLRRLEARGLALVSHALVPAGFSWMNDPRTRRLQGPFTAGLAALHRLTGIDLGRDANFVMHLRRGPAPGKPVVRRVTHVCRACGEHAIVDAARPWPSRWRCPWCGHLNPFGRPR